MDPTVLTALRQLQNDLRGSLTLYNDRCPPPEDGTPPIVPEIQKLCTISRKEITTMQLGFSGATVTAAGELVVDTSRSLNALMILGWQSTANAGEVLFQIIKDHAGELVSATCSFIDAIAAKENDSDEIEKRFVGMVWEKLDAWHKLKLQNRTHITMKLQVNIGMIKDARMELRGEIDAATEEESGEAIAVMEEVWGLIGLMVDICKRLAIVVVVKQEEPISLVEVAAMEWPLQAVDELSENVDDLVISLGPPPDAEEMTEALPAVVERLEDIIAHVKQADESVDDLQKLAESVQEHQQRIQDMIQKL